MSLPEQVMGATATWLSVLLTVAMAMADLPKFIFRARISILGIYARIFLLLIVSITATFTLWNLGLLGPEPAAPNAERCVSDDWLFRNSQNETWKPWVLNSSDVQWTKDSPAHMLGAITILLGNEDKVWNRDS